MIAKFPKEYEEILYKFIIEYKDLINNNEYLRLYSYMIQIYGRRARDAHMLALLTCAFTEMLLDVGVDPLKYMTKVPENYLAYSSISDYTIPNNITHIGESAFYECENLQSIKLPDDLIEIGASSFNGCSELEQIKLPKSVKYIRDGAFENCGVYNIRYLGTKDDFKKIIIEPQIGNEDEYINIHCTNGDLYITSEGVVDNVSI